MQTRVRFKNSGKRSLWIHTLLEKTVPPPLKDCVILHETSSKPTFHPFYEEDTKALLGKIK
jgi:hypothetical protein